MRVASLRRTRAVSGRDARPSRARLRVAAVLGALVASTFLVATPAYAAGTVTVHGTVPDTGDPLAEPVTVFLSCQSQSVNQTVAPGGSYSLTVAADAAANCFVMLSGTVYDSTTQIRRPFVSTGNDDLTVDFAYPDALEVTVLAPSGSPLLVGSANVSVQDTITFADGSQGTLYSALSWDLSTGPARLLDGVVSSSFVYLENGYQLLTTPYESRPGPGQLTISVPAPQQITVSGTLPAPSPSYQSSLVLSCKTDQAVTVPTSASYSLSVMTYEIPYCSVVLESTHTPSAVQVTVTQYVPITAGSGTGDFVLPDLQTIDVRDAQGLPVSGAVLHWNSSTVTNDGLRQTLAMQSADVALTGNVLTVPLLVGDAGAYVNVRMDSGEYWSTTLAPAELTNPSGVLITLPPIVNHVVSGRLEGAAVASGSVSVNCSGLAFGNASLASDGSYSVVARGFLAPECRLNLSAYDGTTRLSYNRDITVPAPVGGEARMWAPLAAPAPFAVEVTPDGGPLRSVMVGGIGTMATPDGGSASVSGQVTLDVPGVPVVGLIPRGDGSYALYDDNGKFSGGSFSTLGADGGTYDAASDTWSLTPSADGDGVPGFVEGGAPNGGDGNNDGTPDADQPEVTSLPAATGDYLTLVAPAGTTFGPVSASSLDGLPAPPVGSTLPSGLVSFRVDGLAAGGAATVRIYSASLAGVTGWAKFHDGAWTSLPASDVSVNEAGGYVDITLTDGGPFDDDGTANGSILDPGGPVAAADSAAPVVICDSAPATWSATDVPIACTASDAGSGLADPADASFTLTTSVAAGSETPDASTSSRQVCDVIGNCATAGPVTGIKVDRRGPDITITAPTDGAGITQGSAPSAAYSCSDAGSGAGTCTGTVALGQLVPTTALGTNSFTVTATDAVGNESTASVSYVVSAANTAPVVSADMGVSGLQAIGSQSGRLELTSRFTDAEGNGPFTAAVQWAPGTAFVPATVSGTTVKAATTYPSGGTRTVVVRVCDTLGACGTDTVSVRTFVRSEVEPVAQCVVDRGRTTSPRYVGRFGYTSEASIPLWIPVRARVDNTFTRDAADRGQPTVFLPGRQRGVFEVAFASGNQTWRLNGDDASVSASTRRC